MKPVDRVWRALVRCSRDRWLPPQEVEKLARAFAKCACHSPNIVANTATTRAFGCTAMGLLRGKTPFPVSSPSHMRFMEVLRNKNVRKLKTIEEEILRITIKELTT